MRVVFMGTPDFAVGTLEAIIADGHEVAAVITQPDKPKGRGKSIQFTPVKEVALTHELPVLQPKKVRDLEFVEELRKLNPEVIVVVAFGQIIPQAVLDIPKYGCLNVHASLLPKYRGAAPIQWAVIDGEKESGVTIMRMDAGLDTGDMIKKVVVSLDDKETGGTLFDKLSQAGAKLLVDVLKDIEAGSAVYEKQPQESTTEYAKMIDKKMGQIDWNQSAEVIERLIRGLNPWPSAYTHINGKTLKIWEADVIEENSGKPGEILKVTKKEILVQAGKKALSLQEVQLEGKKRMHADAFLRGYSLEEGTFLGA
ncbi:MAG: methionyl-tRNA formyltransferase [Lachnospiraceae bacterium]|nr:methionyl-tRNA formyltransferase [Lachnospiraceae bacterium]MDD3617129.1 methionyl-tRNA formyltransferase [Lachnospiraceae bacterium]